MVLALNPLLESGGVTFTRSGGSESLSPPVGGIILAQPEFRAVIPEIERIMIEKSRILLIQ